VFALVLLTAGSVWFWSHRRNAEIHHVRAILTDEFADIRREEKQRAALAARAEVLRKQQAVLDEMRAGESWAARVAELAAAVPDQAVLRRIETVSARQKSPSSPPVASANLGTGPPATEVQLEGYAADHQVLATFLHRLQASGAYREVWLVRSSAAKNGPGECLDFAITCRR
jgi:hypothetical protein